MTPAQLHLLSRVEVASMVKARVGQGRGGRSRPGRFCTPGDGSDLLKMAQQLNTR